MALTGRLTTEVRAYWQVARPLPFGSLLGSTGLSSMASSLIGLLLTIYVYRDSGSSGLALGVLFVSTFLPNLVVAPTFSGLADRFNRRLILAVSDLLRVAVCLALLRPWPTVALLVFAFLTTSASALAKPARYALIPDLCPPERLVKGNALVMLASSAAAILSGVVATLAVTSWGRLAFLPAAACALAAAVLSLVSYRSGAHAAEPPAHPGEPARPRSRLVQGFQLVVRSRPLRWLTVSTTLLWFGLGAQESSLIVFADRALHADETLYPVLVTVGAIGGLVGTAVTPAISEHDRVGPERAFSASLLAAGLAALAFAVSGHEVLGFVWFVVFSATYAVSNVLDEYLEQVYSPVHLRATIISSIGAVGTAGYLIGGALGGPLTDLVPFRYVAVGVAVVIVGAGAIGWLFLRAPVPQSDTGREPVLT